MESQRAVAASRGGDRLEVLSQQMLSPSPCSGAVKTLPRFDAHILESYIDDLRELKQKVYDLFKANPELLPVAEEGLSKGVRKAMVGLL
jgi:hypothetical protein